MFDRESIDKHIGTEVKFRKRLSKLEEVQDYFIDKCKEVGIDWSHDCTADENTYFDTINYTTYAGMFIMHPLSFGQQVFQMYDAKADNLPSAGHVEWVADNLSKGRAGKYVKGNGQELEKVDFGDFEAIAVLAGSNKFFQHTSKKKFDLITRKYGKRLVLKPHPITTPQIIGEIFTSKGKAQMADRHDDLYSIMEKAKVVYTTHISETALTALIMGKEIKPLDPFGARLVGAFSHINHFCFSEPKPLETISSIFASPKSGVVHPEVDADWKAKVDAYFDYIMGQREIQKDFYLE